MSTLLTFRSCRFKCMNSECNKHKYYTKFVNKITICKQTNSHNFDHTLSGLDVILHILSGLKHVQPCVYVYTKFDIYFMFRTTKHKASDKILKPMAKPWLSYE